MKNIYAVLDIGSATLKFLVAEISNINVNVLFVKTIPSHGVKKGIIEDDRILTEAKEKAEQIVENSKKEANLQKERIVGKAEQEIRSLILDAAVTSMQSQNRGGALYDEFLTKAGETHAEH